MRAYFYFYWLLFFIDDIITTRRHASAARAERHYDDAATDYIIIDDDAATPPFIYIRAAEYAINPLSLMIVYAEPSSPFACLFSPRFSIIDDADIDAILGILLI